MPRSSPDRLRPIRYVINGLVATAVHFGVLTINIEWLKIDSAGLSNLIASCVGITTSFLGSRHFVFIAQHKPVFGQAVRFGVLYASIAILHGLVLYGWTDVLALDYRIGFAIATVLQVMLSYFGNQRLVFRA